MVGGLGDLDGALGCLHGLPAGLRTLYACAPRSRWRRAMNKLAKAQVTSRRWVFLLSPRSRTLAKPNTRLMTPIACSTLARIFDLVRFFARSISSTTPR